MSCKCYHAERNFLGKTGVCWGTKECEACSCDGDESRCDFYEDLRKRGRAMTGITRNKDYIRRDEMIKQLKERLVLGVPEFKDGLEVAIEVATEIPASDVMEMIRCRECIYWEPASPTRTDGYCIRSFDFPACATDFCSYGSKRKNG